MTARSAPTVPAPAMQASIPAIMAPAPRRDNPLTRSLAGVIGMAFLATMVLACLATLPWTLARAPMPGVVADTQSLPRYMQGNPRESRLPPSWSGIREADIPRVNAMVPAATVERIAARHNLTPDQALATTSGPVLAELREHWPTERGGLWGLLGTDFLGRSLLVRCLTGGGISLGIGIAAAALSVFIGTMYGAIAGSLGGKVDAAMMRIVDILYGLPYILLVVLLAVASDAALDEYISRSNARAAWIVEQARPSAASAGYPDTRDGAREFLASSAVARAELDARARQEPGLQPRNVSEARRSFYDLVVLLFAIGGVSWLTMARVVRGQVLSLRSQPFMEAARAMGVGWFGQFRRHLLPNLVGPIIVYATLTVPQAILQESFLSFLGIGVSPPLPSWGNLAAEGLSELNTYRSHWWLLVFPCLLLGTTLLALNFVGEGLREALDPKRARRG